MLDALDHRILQTLQADPRSSYRKLARRCGTTAPTAIARTQRMMDLGAIRGFALHVAPWALERTGLVGPPQTPGPDAPTCHQCHGPLPEDPVQQRIAGHHHAFCCTVCRDTMRERAAIHGV